MPEELVYDLQGTLHHHMSYSQHFLQNLMDMGTLLGTISGAILNCKRGP